MELQKQIQDIKARVNKLEVSRIDTNIIDNNLYSVPGEEVVRSFRINKEIQEQFKEFCRVHISSSIRQKDIISIALKEFLNKQK